MYVLSIISIGSLGQIANVPGIGSSILHEKKYTAVEGTPFLYLDWQPGSITDNTKKIYVNQLMKYDTYQDELQINQDGKVLALSDVFYTKFEFAFVEKESNASIRRTFQSGYKVPGFSEKNYFEVLYDGNYKFLKKTKTEFVEQNVSSYGRNSNDKKFITRESYYLIDKSGQSFECRLNKKSFLEILGEDKPRAETLMTNNKLKAKSESDFITILNILEHP